MLATGLVALLQSASSSGSVGGSVAGDSAASPGWGGKRGRAQLVKSVASKTNDVVGDDMTTATVLAQSLYSERCKAVVAGMNPHV